MTKVRVIPVVIMCAVMGGLVPPSSAQQIKFPTLPEKIPEPSPKIELSSLPMGQLYVITSETPVLILAVPEGIVSISQEDGPLTINAVFVGESKRQTRRFTDKQVSIIEGLQQGRVELIIVPVGVKDKDSITRKSLEVTEGTGPRPPPKPDPQPKPPDPKPKDEAGPIPADGLHVIIVYDSKNALPHMTQESILYGAKTRKYLDENCIKATDGRASYRIWGNDINGYLDSKLWGDAQKLAVELPYVVISNGKKGGFKGPLPKTSDEFIKLIEKYK